MARRPASQFPSRNFAWDNEAPYQPAAKAGKVRRIEIIPEQGVNARMFIAFENAADRTAAFNDLYTAGFLSIGDEHHGLDPQIILLDSAHDNVPAAFAHICEKYALPLRCSQLADRYLDRVGVRPQAIASISG